MHVLPWHLAGRTCSQGLSTRVPRGDACCPQVLSALSHRSGGHGGLSHVPYRDSKLTTLLWDGLRGRGRALMLACMAPLRQHSDETLTTLHFASMALRVKSEPVVMLEPQARPGGAVLGPHTAPVCMPLQSGSDGDD
jgi:hypothetical protein